MIASDNPQFMYSAANDCTVRKWDIVSGICENIYRFADPISALQINEASNFMYTASWDKMVRVIDLEGERILKCFVACPEKINCMLVFGDLIFVAGCDPTIRAFNNVDGTISQFLGHTGWIYTLLAHGDFLYSGGDDHVVRVWRIETARQVDELRGHDDCVKSLVLCSNMVISCGYDYAVISWDIESLNYRVE